MSKSPACYRPRYTRSRLPLAYDGRNSTRLCSIVGTRSTHQAAERRGPEDLHFSSHSLLAWQYLHPPPISYSGSSSRLWSRFGRPRSLVLWVRNVACRCVTSQCALEVLWIMSPLLSCSRIPRPTSSPRSQIEYHRIIGSDT